MSAPEFVEWPKIARLNRTIVITEKLDGTNGAVVVTADGEVFAQSRSRVLTDDLPDNYGFRAWVYRHANDLANTLGEGVHFGEWWGAGIQRRYGLTGDDKRFSLFNTSRWADLLEDVRGLSVVPVLYEGPFESDQIVHELEELQALGSKAAPGFMKPEGVCIYHTASRSIFKATIEKDDEPKSAAGSGLLVATRKGGRSDERLHRSHGLLD